MVGAIVGSSLIAWFLQEFNFGTFLLRNINEVFNTNYSIAHYYVAFIILGVISEIFFNKI